jgi:hypothetical protein
MGSYSKIWPLAEELAEHVGGGTIKVRGAGLLHVTGQQGGREVRIILNDGSSGVGFVVQARTARAAELRFLMRRDSDGVRRYGLTREKWDRWDDEDAGGNPHDKVFVSTKVCYYGSRAALNELERIWARISAELQQRLVAAVEQTDGVFSYQGRRVGLDPRDEVGLLKARGVIGDLLQLIVLTAAAVDGGAGPYR